MSGWASSRECPAGQSSAAPVSSAAPTKKHLIEAAPFGRLNQMLRKAVRELCPPSRILGGSGVGVQAKKSWKPGLGAGPLSAGLCADSAASIAMRQTSSISISQHVACPVHVETQCCHPTCAVHMASYAYGITCILPWPLAKSSFYLKLSQN